ncbi:MAG: hypothetical protein WBA57_22370 [Elainellaceae cyanobacterium]
MEAFLSLPQHRWNNIAFITGYYSKFSVKVSTIKVSTRLMQHTVGSSDQNYQIIFIVQAAMGVTLALSEGL